MESKSRVEYSILNIATGMGGYIVNNIFGSNLMFISKNFPGTPIEIIYNISGKYFTLIMSLGQMILPFYIVYEVVKQMEKNEELKEQVVLEIKS